MKPLRLLLALSATGLFAWALAASSAAAVPWHGSAASELRLSWSARAERIESCRRLTDDELAARPAHMRQRVECEGRSATYVLRVTVDGRLLDSAVIVGGGLRQDRPIFLLRDYAVAPGEREVRVEFVRREADSARDSAEVDDDAPARDDREARESLQRRGRRFAALPPRLEFIRRVRFRHGEALMLTVERGTLVLRSPFSSHDAEPDR